jgi:predicted metal-dependent HD superfamily phosphohydrolase
MPTTFACSADHRNWLRTKWQTLTKSVAADKAASNATWDMLVRHYSEPHRAYHNLSHITALLRHADANRESIVNPGAVGFAIWFHDVIYDTRARDNEERSAAFARDAMQGMGIADSLIAAVERCILATQKHELMSGVPDLPLFLDRDLAILGAPDELYRQYSEAIRAEYNWVAGPLYRLGRGKVLKRFAQRRTLFFTPAMAARFEAQARRNLDREIRELSFI